MTAMKTPGNTNDKIRNLSYHLAGGGSRKKSIEMTIEPVEPRVSISPHFNASRSLFSFV